jgi:hypothetical protein
MLTSTSWRCGALVTALLLASCGQSPEQIVSGTQHCTEVVLSPDLMMRLSSYLDYPDSVSVWVVQACHPTGTACSPVATYDHAPPPVYAVAGDTLTIEVLGGNLRTHVDKVTTSRAYRVRTHKITGDVGAQGVEAFYGKGRHRCPPSNRQYPR